MFLALVASFGPFAILVIGGAEASFHASGLLVGIAMLISACLRARQRGTADGWPAIVAGRVSAAAIGPAVMIRSRTCSPVVGPSQPSGIGG